MPTTPTGQRVKSEFLKRYGAKKGASVFFGHVNSNRKFAKAVGEMSVYKRGHKNG